MSPQPTSARARSHVWMARVSRDVWATSGRMPRAAIARPAPTASSRPCGDSGQSYQPVNRFCRFQVLCPWRSRISVVVIG